MYETRIDVAFDTVIYIHKVTKQRHYSKKSTTRSHSVRISTGAPAILNEISSCFLQSLHGNTRKIPRLGRDHFRQIHQSSYYSTPFSLYTKIIGKWTIKRKLSPNFCMFFSPSQATGPSSGIFTDFTTRKVARYVTMLLLSWQGGRGSNRHWRQGRHNAYTEALLLLRPQEWLRLHRLSLWCEQYLCSTFSL